MIGIYCITNIKNSKIYIGSSEVLFKRRSQHFSNLRHNRHENSYLQNAFNKYGEENFEFDIIQLVEKEEDLEFYEQKWTDLTQCTLRKYGYSLCEKVANPSVGKYFSKEEKERRRVRFTGENHYAYKKGFTEEHKKNLRIARKRQINHRHTPVLQYDKNGIFIKRWDKVISAARELNIRSS